MRGVENLQLDSPLPASDTLGHLRSKTVTAPLRLIERLPASIRYHLQIHVAVRGHANKGLINALELGRAEVCCAKIDQPSNDFTGIVLDGIKTVLSPGIGRPGSCVSRKTVELEALVPADRSGRSVD